MHRGISPAHLWSVSLTVLGSVASSEAVSSELLAEPVELLQCRARRPVSGRHSRAVMELEVATSTKAQLKPSGEAAKLLTICGLIAPSS